MKTNTAMISRPQPILPALASSETIHLMQLGQQRGWETMILGQAPLPEAHVRVGNWLIVPIEEDTSLIPARALRRVQAIYEAGLRPKGFVVVHEAPLVLPAPETHTPHESLLSKVGPHILPVLGVVGRIVGVVAMGLAAIGVTAIGGLPLVLLLGVAMLDPILVAVTDDGHWVEIDRWWGEP